MKVEYREYILSILNEYWNELSEVRVYEFSQEDYKKILSFVTKNRIEGYFYWVLYRYKQSHSLYQQVSNIYKHNLKLYKRAITTIEYVAKCLEWNRVTYAFVNGSYFIPFVCVPGERIQKDIDILTTKEDYEQIHTMLIRQGFVQSIIQDGKIRAASRIEKKVAEMNNGRIIPYYKFCPEGTLGDVWIDIDITEENSAILLEKITFRTCGGGMSIPCLRYVQNMTYSCKKIYMKAKNYRYVCKQQDALLYNFCELNQLLYANFDCFPWRQFGENISKMKQEREVFFVLLSLLELFDKVYNGDQKRKILGFINGLNISDCSFINQIVDDKSGIVFTYECSFKEWIFSEDRLAILSPVVL